ncbi:fetal and adult testis-expressed transcript protein isoform X2 [Hemicordylus capensis]|uniref:fetal and adult testis-expressed transcript protein isoform X2 n=1 Tax=Hemicordylus capensis TaxID=884348 RepID=UPI002304C404|nr:fetal and adult testis-expressed transcript protein isoform X2 [Hemicordylus capensis]
MWPGWRVGLDKSGCDLGFTEAINKRMQVPSRLKVADEESSSSGGPQRNLLDELPPSFQMHVPDRLLLAEMADVAFRPFLRQQGPAGTLNPLLEPAVRDGEHPFLSFASRAGSQKRRRTAHQGRARKERSSMEEPLLSPGGVRRLEPGPPPAALFPPFPVEGRIYSLQNVLQALHFLGLQLFQLFGKPAHARLSSQEASLTLEEGPLEEFGSADILAMKKQLARISGRLRSLEEQCVGWRQKELLAYSVLVSVCLLNVWLWLRR